MYFVINAFHTKVFSHVIIGIDQGRSGVTATTPLVICCPAGTSLELRSQDVPAPDNKSLRCCRRNSHSTVINPLNLTGMHVLSYALLLTNSIFLPCRHASPQVTTMNSSFTFGQSANGHHRPITPDDDGLSYSSTELDASVQEPSGMNSFLNGNHQSNLTFGSGKTSFVTSLWNGKTRKVLEGQNVFWVVYYIETWRKNHLDSDTCKILCILTMTQWFDNLCDYL